MVRGKHADERSTVTGVACWLAVQLFFLLMADREARECETEAEGWRGTREGGAGEEKDRDTAGGGERGGVCVCGRQSLNNAAGGGARQRERRKNEDSCWIVRLAWLLLNDTGREFDGR